MIDPDIPLAIEWPRGCIYWRLRKVIKVVEERNLTTYNFDGCSFGTVSLDGAPIKKPWTVATGNATLGNALAAHCCTCTVEHAQGRGESLKRTESYSFKMTDLIHRSFAKSSQAAAIRALVCTRASSRNTMAPPIIEQIISTGCVSGSCLVFAQELPQFARLSMTTSNPCKGTDTPRPTSGPSWKSRPARATTRLPTCISATS